MTTDPNTTCLLLPMLKEVAALWPACESPATLEPKGAGYLMIERIEALFVAASTVRADSMEGAQFQVIAALAQLQAIDDADGQMDGDEVIRRQGIMLRCLQSAVAAFCLADTTVERAGQGYLDGGKLLAMAAVNSALREAAQ